MRRTFGIAGAALLVAVSAADSGAIHRPPQPACAASFTDAFYVGGRRSGDAPAANAMLDPAAGGPNTLTTLRWGMNCSAVVQDGSCGCTQRSFSVVVQQAGGGPVMARSGVVGSRAQRYDVPSSVLFAPATRYTWTVQATVSTSDFSTATTATTVTITSSEHHFFTAPAQWQASPIWAPKNATGGWPTFALLRYGGTTTATTTPAAAPRTVTGGVVFVTANAPTANLETGSPRPPKVLAAYKLWVQGKLLGMGPGRGRCSPGVVCDGQPFGANEQVFDGFDVTAQLAGVAEDAVELFVTGFGIDQSGGKFASGRPKLLLELHLRLSDNTSAVVATGGTTASWQAFDADPVYNPTGNSGCSWYWYPHENFNATRAPPNTPLRPGPAPRGENAASDTAGWTTTVQQPAFAADLVAKPVAPVAVLDQPEAAINVTQIGPNRYFIDLGREVQGGLRLALHPRTGAQVVQVEVTVAEELTGPSEIMFPPRTGTKPRVSWTLDAGSAPAAEHHEYLEFRYAELDFGSPPPPGPPGPGPHPGPPGPSKGATCQSHVGEGGSATIDCGIGRISGFTFASFGTSTGSCPDGPFSAAGQCSQRNTTDTLTKLCVGKHACTVDVGTKTFGEPCHKTHKWLTFNATCSRATTAAASLQQIHEQHPDQWAGPVITRADFSVSAWKVHLPYDTSNNARFESSSTDLNAVWELCRYTIEASSLDLYADSNARQRSADCSADDITALQGQFATTNELALQKYAVEQLFANGPAGRVDWAVLPIIGMWHHMMHSGDLTLATQMFDYAVANISRLESISRTSGLVENQEALVDWPIGMTDRYVHSNTSTISSAWVFYGATTLVKMATVLNRTADADRLGVVAARLKAAMNAKQWNSTAGAFCDGLCDMTPHLAFHSTMYTLAFGAVSDDHIEQAWKYVRSRVDPPFNRSRSGYARSSNGGEGWPPPPPPGNYGMPCGVYPSQFTLTALYQNPEDQGAAALAVLTSDAKNTWLSMLKKGATMTMEMWSQDEKPNLTWSHPWASSPAFIVAWYLFGIRPLAPGFATVAIKPQVGTLAAGRYTLPTVLGPIAVHFGKTATSFDLHVSLPAASVGEIAIPLPRRTAAAATAQGSVVSLRVDGSLVAAKVENGFAMIQVHGGSHHIKADDRMLSK